MVIGEYNMFTMQDFEDFSYKDTTTEKISKTESEPAAIYSAYGFKVNDYVYLLEGYHRPCPSNPALNSIHECEGVITSISSSGAITVFWSNGTDNTYSGPSLTHKKRAKKVSTGCNSIW